MFAIQERERKLTAYEIHDGIIQYAAGALMLLEAQEGRSSNIRDVTAQLQKIMEEGRRLVNGLGPPVLDEAGVVAAISHLICEQETASLQIMLEVQTDFDRLDPRLEICIYRIVQEAITNAKKHSRSDKVRIELGHDGQRVHLEIRDWGVGFDHDVCKPGSHGLRGMTERVQLLGGNLAIEGAPGAGTNVRVDFPILVG